MEFESIIYFHVSKILNKYFANAAVKKNKMAGTINKNGSLLKYSVFYSEVFN